ncbi:MAG TPA: PDZ domain-containing protein [Flavobacteriaceae bacterium]|nr:PDZ domain-containing protein [Flavobacteriaceae bacterium]
MMKRFISVLSLLYFTATFQAQVASKYTVSFENAVHHEAQIKATFTNLKTDEVEFRMSRSSPGRYALHEFAKNVYNVMVTDGKGHILKATRPDPYSWHVKGQDGTINVSYTLFANHGDGTYAQVDETHAHLNMPATFMYVPELSEQGMEVTFNVRKDLNWKVATQLKHEKGNTYYAQNLQYFMDSPTEISNYKRRSFKVGNQTINFVLHDDEATNEYFDQYFESVKKIVLQEKEVFGELPNYDYGEYTFLACYMPNVDGDGMEHRNSTIMTTTRSLAHGGIQENISTASHEFFHCWNVERIRPKSLEPFDFTRTNMSGELWFAEGFTNYYDALTQCRTGIWSLEHYLKDMTRGFNYVWTSPGRQFFNIIQMSYKAPFVDAATSIDDTNWENTFISYYNYGEMLGLALDLSLREINLNLDDYMKLMWKNFGKRGKSYTVEDLKTTLVTYAGKEFGDKFFSNYIYKSGMPDYKKLFRTVGINLTVNESKVSFGAEVRYQKIMDNPRIGTTAYLAGFQKGDKILKIGGFTLNDLVTLDMVLDKYKVDDKVMVMFQRYNKIKEVEVSLKTEKLYDLSLMDADSTTGKMVQNRAFWLHLK